MKTDYLLMTSTQRVRRWFRLLVFALALAGIMQCRQQTAPELVTLNGLTMGTSYMVKYLQTGAQKQVPGQETVQQAIDEVLKQVNQQMSTYIEDSEISRFNRYRKTDWFPVSRDFALVLDEALKLAEFTGGALDVTIGPLVNLWGFGPEARPTQIPSEEEIQKRLKLVGYHLLEVRPEPPAVRKKNANVYCDLSSIAKGFGVDKVSAYLDSLNIRNYLVEIGGEVRGRGTGPGGAVWRVGVATPDRGFDIRKVVKISNLAMATSGDYHNYFEADGVRYSHTIDPRTGRPIQHKLASVTVAAASCMEADGLATALDVMGPEQGIKFAREHQLAVFMLVREGTRFKELMTPSFEKLVQK